ncbi:MAG: hypothetical protein NTW32_18930 [Chloroflexi bacterium]|nr:hypothetical protein [Chloroflexota bacterium]
MSNEPKNTIPAPPIHPLAALATIALDGFFTIFEVLDPLMLLFISSGIGLLGFLTTSLVQHYLAKDEWGPAIAKGMVMGIFAGIPYPVAGTAIGAPLLIWAGVHRWITRSLPESGNNQIVDSIFKNEPKLEGKEADEY